MDSECVSMTVPVLQLIGSSDRRVAPSQGIRLYHALKARYASLSPNGRVEMLVRARGIYWTA